MTAGCAQRADATPPGASAPVPLATPALSKVASAVWLVWGGGGMPVDVPMPESLNCVSFSWGQRCFYRRRSPMPRFVVILQAGDVSVGCHATHSPPPPPPDPGSAAWNDVVSERSGAVAGLLVVWLLHAPYASPATRRWQSQRDAEVRIDLGCWGAKSLTLTLVKTLFIIHPSVDNACAVCCK